MKVFSVQIKNDEFHKKLGGGLPPGTIALIKGGHGSGKSIVCQRMVYGMLNNDIKISYVSTQLTTTDFVKQMLSLGYNIVHHIIKGNLKFFPVYPLINEMRERGDYTKRLISARSIFESDVVYIDSFSSLIKFDIDDRAVVDLMSFLKRIVATGKAVVLTAVENELPNSIMEEVESCASLIIETTTKKVGTDLKNVMLIRKYNFAVSQYSKQTAFRVEPNIGLVVEIAAVS
ncbi:MAG: flagellar accessory protein FlaH [Archaeoglobus sp.]|nr:MAG: flagellar accessory protein FlaH [Archaeoglobus sp.]